MLQIASPRTTAGSDACELFQDAAAWPIRDSDVLRRPPRLWGNDDIDPSIGGTVFLALGKLRIRRGDMEVHQSSILTLLCSSEIHSKSLRKSGCIWISVCNKIERIRTKTD